MKEIHAYLLMDFPAMLKQLKNDSERQFGIMTPVQMLDHLRKAFLHSHSGKEVEMLVSDEIAQKGQAFIASDKEIRPGAQMSPFYDEIEDNQEELEEMKLMVLQEMIAMLSDFDKDPQFEQVHPKFGRLNVEQWLRLHKKHTAHHMRQFGLSPQENKPS